MPGIIPTTIRIPLNWVKLATRFALSRHKLQEEHGKYADVYLSKRGDFVRKEVSVYSDPSSLACYACFGEHQNPYIAPHSSDLEELVSSLKKRDKTDLIPLRSTNPELEPFIDAILTGRV